MVKKLKKIGIGNWKSESEFELENSELNRKIPNFTRKICECMYEHI